ncbi:MAG: hypothetical protein LBI64_07260 [Coriobacteriales bacterium]|jgi:G3E family GTPase|nr:hypothetical protein [Coriobacteriales bacterium]
MNAIILSGFLGAGKTSFLLQLASHLTRSAQQSKGESEDDSPAQSGLPSQVTTGAASARVAILENEIGKISVDGAQLKARGIEVRELFSGCVCCTLSGELADTVYELQEALEPDWLIVEATGLAYPDKTAEAVRVRASALERLRIVVLVDAARFLALEKISPLVAGQAACADVLLLNKIDLVDDAKRCAVRARLTELNPKAPIVEIVATEPIGDALWQELL